MAIDLCNKLDLFNGTQGTGSQAALLDDEVTAWESLSPHQRENLNVEFKTTLTHVDPRLLAGDPAAWSSDFGFSLDRIALRLDQRSEVELAKVALTHADPVMREQALFEYADRNAADAVELLCQAVEHDRDRKVRWNTLWALEKLGGLSGIQALRRYQKDADPEIAEWSTLFTSELETSEPAFDNRDCRFTPGRTFDETIYLLIHCDLYVRLDPTNRVWGKLTLAPQALARIYGDAHACPNVATRERQLVIAKTISGLHKDGTPHMDNYLFRGFTERTHPRRGNFYFESSVERPFFVSGHADDTSKGVQDARIGFNRSGCWFLEPRFQVKGSDAIRYVRGRFQGWGYFNLEKLVGASLEHILVPGNAILSTLHDPIAGPLTNVFISGTFKGKLNDWDGDGRIDLNSRNVYSTVEGELDTNMDGIPDEPGVSCCTHRGVFI
jgi:hypothetical protein